MTQTMQVCTHRNPAPHQWQGKWTRRQRTGQRYKPFHTLTWKTKPNKGEKGKGFLKRNFLGRPPPLQVKLENRTPKRCSCRKRTKGVQNVLTVVFFIALQKGKQKYLIATCLMSQDRYPSGVQERLFCLVFLPSMGYPPSSPELPKPSKTACSATGKIPLKN